MKRYFQIIIVCKNLLEIGTDGFFSFFNKVIKRKRKEEKWNIVLHLKTKIDASECIKFGNNYCVCEGDPWEKKS